MPRLFVFFCLCLPICAQQVSTTQERLDNQAILTMVRAGLSDEVVLAKIRSTPARFDVSAQALADLKKNGVSERVIMAMLETANPQLRQRQQGPGTTPPMMTAPPRTATPQIPPRQEPVSAPPPYTPSAAWPEDEVTENVIIFGGLAYSRGDLDANFFGWATSTTFKLAERLGVKADLSGGYTDIDFDQVDVSLYSFAFGPEFRAGSDRLSGFGHALVGWARYGESFENVSVSDNNLEFVFGGGLDIWLTERFGIRAIQGDLQHIRAEGEGFNQGRISAGAVFRF